MSILNVNQIQPVGGGNTITVNASDVSAAGATITASSFVGAISGNTTGDVTGNVTGNLTGNVTGNLTGNVTGNLTGNVTGNADTATTSTTSTNAQGLTGSPNINVGSVTGTTATFSGNVSIGGTLTYEDVTNVDSVGIITARDGIKASGESTFNGNVGIQTNDISNSDLVGAGNSFVGLYIGDGSLFFSSTLNRPGGYYITTSVNALNAGPVTLGSTMTLDGTWVIV